MMNSRERTQLALDHREPDRVPMDLGGSSVTGITAISVYLLRQAYRLDPPGTPVKVIEPYQMLGEIEDDLVEALGIDVLGLMRRKNLFGFANEAWKPWNFNGVPVLVPGQFNTIPESNGDLLMYPEGDRTVSPSGRMPAGGFYFDSIIRQPPIDDSKLNVEDNLEEFGPISSEDLAFLKKEADRLSASGKGVLANFGGTGFGDIALVPAPWLKHPKGIRDVAEWYMSTLTRSDYVYAIFEKQCEIALENLAKIYAVVGDLPSAVMMSGTDFGTQTATFISPKTYRKLYQPFHKALNDWVHKNTPWKCFIHSCGSVLGLIPDFIASGFDILNPVQTSATGMDPHNLKREFGKDLVFWGGGIDTQHTLPFGKPADIRAQVKERLAIFGRGGGYVFNPIHNVQAGIPEENLIALIEAVREFRNYPLT